MHRDKVYYCNFVGLKGKVNTPCGIKGKVKSLVLSVLIKSLKFSSRGCKSSLGRTTLNLLDIVITFLSWYY